MNTVIKEETKKHSSVAGGLALYSGLFLLGGLGYAGLEILWRGFTHWTMALTGGFCLCLIFMLSLPLREDRWWHFLLRCGMSALLITEVEFLVGTVVNLFLRWNVWDYSELPFNLFGQICLPYSLLWLFLSAPILFLCGVGKQKFDSSSSPLAIRRSFLYNKRKQDPNRRQSDGKKEHLQTVTPHEKTSGVGLGNSGRFPFNR